MVSGMKLKLMEAWVVCDTSRGLCLCPRCYKQKYVGEEVDHHGFSWGGNNNNDDNNNNNNNGYK
jgi:hypothetical protein